MLYQKYSLRLEGRITNKEELSSHDLEVLFYASYRLYFLQRIPFAISLLFCCLFACTIYHFIYAHLHNSTFASSSFVCFSSAYKLLSRHLSFSLSFLPLFLIPHFSFFPTSFLPVPLSNCSLDWFHSRLQHSSIYFFISSLSSLPSSPVQFCSRFQLSSFLSSIFSLVPAFLQRFVNLTVHNWKIAHQTTTVQ